MTILLSPPDVGALEREAVLASLDSGWVAPAGPGLEAFESALAQRLGVPHAVALSSGTAALHLGLVLLGVGPGDTVVVPTFTFVASANPVRYVGATPLFVDCSPDDWCLDPGLLEDTLKKAARCGQLPRAVIVVDAYGACANWPALVAICDRHGVPILEDAAAALGSSGDGRAAGAWGDFAAVSFNGNKIATCGGGGALVGRNGAALQTARQLAAQAREPAAHYEHRRLGYNYRMGSLPAALGRAQLQRLPELVARRRAHAKAYRQATAHLAGVRFLPQPTGRLWNGWLSCALFDPTILGVGRTVVADAMAQANIEVRPLWKPLHRQPLFAQCEHIGGAVADALFAHGLCLPSGTSLHDDERQRVVNVLLAAVKAR